MAGSATVGMLRAILSADTAQFDSAMGKSSAKIDDISKTATRAQQNLVKMLGGDALIKKATDIQQAMGMLATKGIKLTADEATRMEATVSKAIAKLEAMGKAVPDALVKTQAALKQTAAQTDKSAMSFENLAKSGKGLLGMFGVGIGVGAVTGFVTHVFDAADAIGDLALKMGVSVEAAQRFQFAARQSGAELEDVARAVAHVNAGIGEGHGSGVSKALESLGLHFDTIRTMKPEDVFRATADAIGSIADPMQQAAAAAAVFGDKLGANLLPMIRENSLLAADAVNVMSEETIRSLKDSKQAWENFWSDVVTISGKGIALLKAHGNEYADYLNKLSPVQSFASWLAGKGIGAVSGAVGAVSAVSNTNIPRLPIAAALQEQYIPAIQSADEATKAFNSTDGERIKKLTEHLKALQTLEEEYQKWKHELLTGLTDAQRKQIEWELRFQKETGQDVFVLNMKANSLERVLAATLKLNAVPIPKTGIGPPPLAPFTVNNSGLVNGLVPGGTQMGSLGPAPSVPFSTRLKNDLQALGPIISMVDQALADLTQNSSEGWKEVAAGIHTATAALQAYAAGASAASAASTALIGFVLSTVVNVVNSRAAIMQESIDIIDQIRALGGDVSMLHASPLGANLDFLRNRLNDIRQRIDLVTHSIEDFGKALDVFGGHAPAALRPYLNALIQSGRLTAEQIALLQGFAASPSWQQLQQDAESVGISIDALGQGFQQTKLNDQAKKFFGLFTEFTDAGADPQGVLAGMADEFQGLLDDARKFHLTIPQFLKPILDQMIHFGFLHDAAGNNLTDLLEFQFNDLRSPLDEAVDWLAKIYGVLAPTPGPGGGGAGVPGPPSLPGSGSRTTMPVPGAPGPGGGGGGMPVVVMPSVGGGGASAAWTAYPSPSYAGASGGDTYVIQAMDSRTFEEFLKSGANRAVMRTLPEAVQNATLARK